MRFHRCAARAAASAVVTRVKTITLKRRHQPESARLVRNYSVTQGTEVCVFAWWNRSLVMRLTTYSFYQS